MNMPAFTISPAVTIEFNQKSPTMIVIEVKILIVLYKSRTKDFYPEL